MTSTKTGQEPTIECPKCGTRIGITEALSHQAQDLVKQELQAGWDKQQQQREAQFAEDLKRAREKAAIDARDSTLIELAELKGTVATRDAQVAEMRKTELDLRHRTRDLDERAKQMELDVARRVDRERAAVEATVTQRLVEEHRMNDLAKDKQLADLKVQIEDANRRAQQGSQQTQGEALEEHLEAALRAAFPYDTFEPVQHGQRGADILQVVRDARGVLAGRILWEAKNTKVWTDRWPAKLRDDQRECGAVIAIIVTKALPTGLSQIGHVDGVWITAPLTAIALGQALRSGLIETGRARAAHENQNEKQAALYEFLSGPEFMQGFEGVVEPLIMVHEQNDKERRALEASHAKKQKALEQVVWGLAALYGKINGVIGGILPPIRHLELPPAKEDQAA